MWFELNGATFRLEIAETNTEASYSADKKPIPISRSKYADVEKAATTYVDALSPDPALMYMRRTPDHKPRLENFLNRANYRVLCAIRVAQRKSFTANHGDAFVNIMAPRRQGSGKGYDILEKVLRFYMGAVSKLNTPIQRRRAKETSSKFGASVSKFGARINEMVNLTGLVTSPAMQHQGYGGALVDFVISHAEKECRTTWLASSNIANTSFYQEHGFETSDSFALGDTDPDWSGEPIVVHIMTREPRHHTHKSKNC